MKLVIIYHTVTQNKPSVRMDCTCIDYNDSYIFFDSYIYFCHIIGKISLFRQSHPCKILHISSCYFLLNNLCKIIAYKKSSRYDQKLERGYREFRISIPINDLSNSIRQIYTTDQNKSFRILRHRGFCLK